MKRILDILFSSLLCIIVFSVIAPVISAVIFFKYRCSPIFKQERIGLGGKPFYIYKFRTMQKDVSCRTEMPDIKKAADGFIQFVNDPRVTRVGRLLRKTSIDELPQFFNVLCGDMSLVGPRPLICEDVKQLSKKHMRRFEVLPGITGYAQINGRSFASLKNREDNDLYYIDNLSFYLDMKIILKTLIVLPKKDIVC